MAKFSAENPGAPFQAGRVANALGRPRTADRLRRDVAAELLKHGATLTRLAVQKALAGDPGCLAACVALIGTLEGKKAKRNDPPTAAD
ncbi:hypothetical protein ACNHE5_19390 [Pandoraea pnomenusa]|uniref:hypothetical protein n=1 Tax=Pandoraea pnomenusa TaxID=93220 RepID=UPI003CF4F74E